VPVTDRPRHAVHDADHDTEYDVQDKAAKKHNLKDPDQRIGAHKLGCCRKSAPPVIDKQQEIDAHVNKEKDNKKKAGKCHNHLSCYRGKIEKYRVVHDPDVNGRKEHCAPRQNQFVRKGTIII